MEITPNHTRPLCGVAILFCGGLGVNGLQLESQPGRHQELEKLAAIVPLPRAHLVRYAGCLAPHSKLRATIIPTPRQQGVGGEETKTGTPYWNWAI